MIRFFRRGTNGLYRTSDCSEDELQPDVLIVIRCAYRVVTDKTRQFWTEKSLINGQFYRYHLRLEHRKASMPAQSVASYAFWADTRKRRVVVTTKSDAHTRRDVFERGFQHSNNQLCAITNLDTIFNSVKIHALWIAI